MAKKYLITGGAGFIGSNYVNRLLERGEHVTIFDNLSRAGAQRNLAWLKDKFGETAFWTTVGDVRNPDLICEAAREADTVITISSARRMLRSHGTAWARSPHLATGATCASPR